MSVRLEADALRWGGLRVVPDGADAVEIAKLRDTYTRFTAETMAIAKPGDGIELGGANWACVLADDYQCGLTYEDATARLLRAGFGVVDHWQHMRHADLADEQAISSHLDVGVQMDERPSHMPETQETHWAVTALPPSGRIGTWEDHKALLESQWT